MVLLAHVRRRSVIPILQEAGIVYAGAEADIYTLESGLNCLHLSRCESCVEQTAAPTDVRLAVPAWTTHKSPFERKAR